MEKELRDKFLQKIAHDNTGEAFRDWLEEKMMELKDITKIKTEKEMLGKQEAMKVLTKLFKFLYEKESKDVGKKTSYA